MKNTFIITCCCLLLSVGNNAQTLAFHQGSLLVSLSEGTTWANYGTGEAGTARSFTDGNTHGVRDPIFLEYGISNKFGIGITSGADIFNVDPAKFYGFTAASGSNVKVLTGELTVDGNYHFFVTKKADLSAYISAGLFSTTIRGGSNEYAYNYTAAGSIVRVGARARYYICKRFGLLANLSSYSAIANPMSTTANDVTQKYSTAIRGLALEFGVCFRFF